jgi:hypothetical protein
MLKMTHKTAMLYLMLHALESFGRHQIILTSLPARLNASIDTNLNWFALNEGMSLFAHVQDYR